MKKSQIKWIVISILVLLAFMFLTPISLIFKFSLLTSIIGGLLSAVFVFFALLKIDSINELFYFEDIEEEPKPSNVYISFAVMFISGILIFNVTDYRVDRKFENEGKFTKARILDGIVTTKKSSRRGTEKRSTITISYKDSLNKIEHITNVSVDSEIFNSLHKGQKVEVIYLPLNPSVFKVLLGDKNIKKYKQITNRDIKLDDIDILFDLENEDKILDYLSSISLGWEKTKEDGDIYYSNSLKKELIIVSEEEKIFFQNNNHYTFTIDNIISKEKIPVDESYEFNIISKILYETDKFYITKVIATDRKAMPTVEEYFIIERKQ